MWDVQRETNVNKRQKALYNRFCSQFFKRSVIIPALCLLLCCQGTPGGSLRKQFTKPSVQGILSLSIYFNERIECTLAGAAGGVHHNVSIPGPAAARAAFGGRAEVMEAVQWSPGRLVVR